MRTTRSAGSKVAGGLLAILFGYSFTHLNLFFSSQIHPLRLPLGRMSLTFSSLPKTPGLRGRPTTVDDRPVAAAIRRQCAFAFCGEGRSCKSFRHSRMSTIEGPQRSSCSGICIDPFRTLCAWSDVEYLLDLLVCFRWHERLGNVGVSSA